MRGHAKTTEHAKSGVATSTSEHRAARRQICNGALPPKRNGRTTMHSRPPTNRCWRFITSSCWCYSRRPAAISWVWHKTKMITGLRR